MSMSNGIGGYGMQNGGTSPQMRPQFRRQGSSFGHGNVHNMAVMVVPTKVDYSVTKGGVRLWAVLFVFIFLCSAMLTVFTEIDDDDDDHPVESSKYEEDEKESDKKYKTSRIVEDADLEDDGEAANPPDRGPSEVVTAADEEDEEGGEAEEEELFAKLQAKAAKQSARRQRKEEAARKAAEEDEEEGVDGDEQQPTPAPMRQSRRRRKQKEVVVEAEPEEIQIPEEPVNAEPEKPKQKKKSARRKKIEVVEDPEDDDEEEQAEIVIEPSEADKDDDNNNDDEDHNEAPEEGEDSDGDNDDDDEEDNDSNVPQPTAQYSRHQKSPKKKAVSWKRNVTPEDSLQPRKNLLKHTKRKQKSFSQFNENANNDENANDDDEEENEDNEDEEQNDDSMDTPEQQAIQDVVSIRKKNPQYNRKQITNRDDYKHRNRLDTADFMLEKHEFAKATSLYDQVLAFNRDSPRAHYGRARSFQLRSEFEGDEHLLDAAIAEYQIVLDDDDTPEVLFRMTADNIIECARYRGNLHKVMTIQRALLDRFPEDVELQNNFGVTFLMMGRIEDARNVFSAVLESNPNNPLAQAYFGYILKVHDRDFERGVQFMRRGLRGADEAIIDAKFYFHLGDGLMRLGRNQEAIRVYEEATHLGLFPSPLQRSFHNLDGLIARPWWTAEQTGCGKHLKHLERQWTVIREEAIKLWQKHEGLFEAEDLHLTEGILTAFPFTRDSILIEENCKKAPQTCNILRKFINDAGCFKGDARISVLQSGTRVWPHCGATNYVLEAQLGLQVTSDARIRVASDVKGWKTGKFLIYDESFEHEVWFDGASANTVRIILSMELWHPEVPQLSRADTLRP